MKIVFFGTPQFAATQLVGLNSAPEIEILCVITQPDKPVGRKKTITPPPVKQLALELGLPIKQPKNAKELEKELAQLRADFFVVIAYGMILPQTILNKAKIASINVHASLLPKYRGASPIQEALLNGDEETGITFMKMAEKLDSGPIFFTKKIPISPEDNLESLTTKLAITSNTLLPSVLEDINAGTLTPIPQNDKQATYCRKITKENGKANPKEKTAQEIQNMLRAYTPWPGIYIELQGKKIKILATEVSNNSLSPGKIEATNKTLEIGTKSGSIIPKTVQVEGKSPMDITSFINGYKHLLK